MAFYNTCERCGATLDPGEPCDCKEEHMVHQASDDISDLIEDIVKQNPRISGKEISKKLLCLYDVKVNTETVRKLTNRMISFGNLRAGQAKSGQIVYYYHEED